MLCRLGDHVPGSGPFWGEVQRRGEGPILALLKHKPTGKIILAGQLTDFKPQSAEVAYFPYMLLACHCMVVPEDKNNDLLCLGLQMHSSKAMLHSVGCRLSYVVAIDVDVQQLLNANRPEKVL